MKTNLYYGWIIAFASAFGVGCSVAVLIPSTLGFMVGPLSHEFGWTAQQIMTATAFVAAMTVVIGPVVGALVDRFGGRAVITVSFLFQALVLLSFYFMDASLPLFYLRYAALAGLCTGGTMLAFLALISVWFRQRRGLAIGIVLSGTGFGGVLWSVVSGVLFSHYGWRETYLWFAGFIGFIATPLMFYVLRDSPASMGLDINSEISDSKSLSLGSATLGSAGESQSAPIELWNNAFTLREAAADRHFWLLMLLALVTGTGVQSIMYILVPLLKEAHNPPSMAGTIQASMWAALVIDRLSTGWLLDRVFAPRIPMVFMIFPIIGVSLFASGASGATAFLAAMLIGLCLGAESDTISYMVSRYFGLRYYSRIYGCCFSAFVVGAGVGPILHAHLAVTTGSYRSALVTVTGILIVGICSLFFYERFPQLDQTRRVKPRAPSPDDLPSLPERSR